MAHDSDLPSGYVDLRAALSAQPWQIACAACRIESPDERTGWLELGSDDGLQVWLNGERRLRRDVYRLAAPAQDLLPIRLRRGENRLALVIGQATGEWGFHCRLTGERSETWTDVNVTR